MLSPYELFWASMGCNEQEYDEAMKEMMAESHKEDAKEAATNDTL